MKSTYYHIYTLLAVVLTLATSSCVDDTFDRGDLSRLPDNVIRFDVSSGFESPSVNSRAADPGNIAENVDLPPVVFAEGSDTLYIHRYVASESERSTGRHPDTDATSRAAQVNDVKSFADVHKNFLVVAKYTDKNEAYIPQTKVEKFVNDAAGDVWYIDNPIYYWLDQRQLRFNAFAPGDSIGMLGTGFDLGAEEITFSYTPPVFTDTEGKRRDAEHQPDLMFATTTCSHNSGTIDHDYVPLNFRHALAAIKFAVRDVVNGEIVDITLTDIAGSGTCTFNPEAESAPAFTWNNLGAPTDYTQTFNYKTVDLYDPDKDNNGIPVGDLTPINDKKGWNDKTFMLIPQEIDDKALLKITFKSGDELKTLSGKLKTADIPLWEAGKEYIYTISTSSELWEYIFEVTGSEQALPNTAEEKAHPELCSFKVNDNSIIVNYTVTENAFYTVKSYRQRKNNTAIKEPVKWSAESTPGTNGSDNNSIQKKIEEYKHLLPMVVESNEWFPDQEQTKFSGGNSGDKIENTYNVVFKSQYVATDWDGDWQMRANHTLGSKDEPIDLSKRNGGLNTRNTANCYIVNRGGWYAIPLVYGNAITNGVTNEKAYKNNRKGLDAVYQHTAHDFVKHDGKEIKSPYIEGADNATLLWSDAYNIINKDSVDLKTIGGEKFVVFKINQLDLQQSNSIIAVRNSDNTILWSWHIWTCEHWFDESDDLVLKKGFVECDTYTDNLVPTTAGVTSFTAAPCNLGWCDVKFVGYLKRTGTITFKQTGNPSTSKPVKDINVLQRGEVIEYWIGNNTYYQWGRKDPMVGFINNENHIKSNFGPILYDVRNSLDPNSTIERGIQEPHALLVAINGRTTNDWIITNSYTYYNLWNNYAGQGDITLEGVMENNCHVFTPEYAYSAVKTVYDPSPAGFVVPPTTFFNIFVNGRADNNFTNSGTTLEVGFNGTRTKLDDKGTDRYKDKYYKWIAYSKKGYGSEITFTPTGQRWDSPYHSTLLISAGQNMNPHIIYLWSNCTNINNNGPANLGNSGYSFVLGEDYPDPTPLVSTTHFNGRKSMARPIRCVKEYQ